MSETQILEKISLNKAIKVNPKFKVLLSKGRSKGFITYKEILKIFPNVEEDIQMLDDLYSYLYEENIDVIEEAEQALNEDLAEDDDEEAAAPVVVTFETTASTDPIRMYLREIGRVKLLTAVEEIKLAKMVEAEKYEKALETLKSNKETFSNSDVSKYLEIKESLVEEYKKQLEDFTSSKEILQMHKARKKLIDSNLRLVVSYAKRYVNRGLVFPDLIQEGNMGLMRAVDKFDWRRGFKFSTYATWWIRQAITRAIADQARTIRIPVHMIETINKLKKVQRELEQKREREATTKELAKAMGVDETKIDEILRISQEPSSLQTRVGEDSDTELSEFIADDLSEDPESLASQELLKGQISEVLDTLSERERKVLELRFGIADMKPKTLEEVGKVFGVTRERIRQIEAKALRKLRHPSRSRKLKDYL